ncbi:MAG: glycosyltransferase [Candidatus Omnitrophica bacterium]|nr:glycosyltransferase [Candidatus Omnitrophota bacterium]
MKIIHIPYCFYPDPVGGTEVYVKNLCNSLNKFGIESIVAAPTEGKDNVCFHEGIKVRRFSISKHIEDLADLYGGSDPVSLKAFGRILDEEKPDLAHFHALTYAVSLGLMRESRSRGIPVIFTYHTPTVSCQSGLLMIWKNQVCKGFLNTRICTACTLYRFNVPRGVSDMLARAPFLLGSLIKKLRLSGKVFTALRMRCLIEKRIAMIRDFIREADRFIVLCGWTKELLLRNMAPLDKISFVRHGITQTEFSKTEDIVNNVSADLTPLKIAYLGRIDWTKGINIVMKALKEIPGEAVEFDIYGVVQDRGGKKYFEKLKKFAKKNDNRVKFMPPVPSVEVVPLLKKYHYLVVPSIWMETGPLVVLEAFASGTPVIGSDLGGIKELVQDDKNGILVSIGSTRKWSTVLKKVSRDRELLKKLRQGISPPRTMLDVARETVPIYNSLISR